MKEVKLAEEPKESKDKSVPSMKKIASELQWKPGAAGLVVAANELARKVKKLLTSAERIQKVLGAVYKGERDHNKIIIRTLRKLSSDGSEGGSATTKGSDEVLLQSAKLSEKMLTQQAARRIHIANDMLEQVVSPLGRVIRDCRMKYSAIFQKHSQAGQDIVACGNAVKLKKKEAIKLIRSCKDARERELEKQDTPEAQRGEGGISSLFQAISSGVSDIVRGKYEEIISSTESSLLQYKQTVAKANKRQEAFIRLEIPRFLKHYSVLSTSLTKMVQRALLSGFEFQKLDPILLSPLNTLEAFVKSIQPQEGLSVKISACLEFYSEVVKKFTCTRWKYDLPVSPLEVKKKFSLGKPRKGNVSDQDFVVVQRPRKVKTRRGDRKKNTKAPNANPKRSSAGSPISITTVKVDKSSKGTTITSIEDFDSKVDVSEIETELSTKKKEIDPEKIRQSNERKQALLQELLEPKITVPKLEDDDEDEVDNDALAIQKEMADALKES
eukprot:CAMPEP_0167751992 /NCGR_PEP_ID=MMETSP0110_2-20121227/6886_1 /TAXON_ID=629695 /ORGANISM="Gymnochlora sp., Strain CCMP2014" /LENGTH=497 /DNA_ID=CAMNT_0007637549 /DNA_START=25 /DNA_END=1518 /DNA_ORIENTATION=+